MFPGGKVELVVGAGPADPVDEGGAGRDGDLRRGRDRRAGGGRADPEGDQSPGDDPKQQHGATTHGRNLAGQTA